MEVQLEELPEGFLWAKPFKVTTHRIEPVDCIVDVQAAKKVSRVWFFTFFVDEGDVLTVLGLLLAQAMRKHPLLAGLLLCTNFGIVRQCHLPAAGRSPHSLWRSPPPLALVLALHLATGSPVPCLAVPVGGSCVQTQKNG